MHFKFLFILLVLIKNSYNFYDRTPLKVLERRIRRNIFEPQKKYSQQLLLDTFKYEIYLDDILEHLENNNTDGLKMLKKIGRDGPQYFSINYNLTMLQQVYRWTEDDSEEFEVYIINAKKIWNSIKTNYNHLLR
uniref:Uncharacterized protein n=1 Tax=Clastoptera arizonana TaxID=38151 RepID=A0A1B6D8J1_9HEMI